MENYCSVIQLEILKIVEIHNQVKYCKGIIVSSFHNLIT